MSFTVDPPRLTRAGEELTIIASAYPAALSYADNVRIRGTGGNILTHIHDKSDEVRGVLQTLYAAGHPFVRYPAAAGAALKATAIDYQGIDRGAAEALDRVLPHTASSRKNYGLDAHGQTPGVTAAELTGVLSAPGSLFEDYDEWRAIQRGVSYAVSLLWVFDALLSSPFFWPLPNPADRIRADFDHDWEEVGRIAVSLRTLEKFFTRVQDESAATALELTKAWSGEAATAAYVSLGGYDDVMAEHQRDLTAVANSFGDYAWSMRFLTDTLCDLLDVVLLLPLDLTMEELLASGPAMAKKILGKVSLIIDAVWLFIDLCASIGTLIMLPFGIWGSYTINVPQQIAPVPFTDVNGGAPNAPR